MLRPQNIKKIYLLAICGTGMGSLAGLLKQKGFEVCGSDANIYPPMSTELERQGIQLFSPYNADNLKNAKPDLVIVGNAIPKTNLEAQFLVDSNIPYMSMPQALNHFFLHDKDVIVVAGTHGKTTTTALMAHILNELGEDPSFMVGGVTKNFASNFAIGNSKWFVIEGDEYDTAFFDKGPKFLHYNPKHVILTSIEFDHADIYRDLQHVTDSFVRLLNIIPADGSLHFCSDYAQIQKAIESSQLSPNCFVRGYGLNAKDWRVDHFTATRDGCHFDVFNPLSNGQWLTVNSQLSGEYNALNVAACLSVIERMGLDVSRATQAISTFAGVRRRQEILFESKEAVIIDDFAHHPTAVRETIKAIRDRFPQHNLIAVFEPRSNTNRRAVFQNEYTASFEGADHVFIAPVNHPEKVTDGHVLNVQRIVDELKHKGQDAHGPLSVQEIVDFVGNEYVRSTHTQKPLTILVMSNGDFGGIHQRLIDLFPIL